MSFASSSDEVVHAVPAVFGDGGGVDPVDAVGSGGAAPVVAIEPADEAGADEFEPGSAAAGKEALPASFGWPRVLKVTRAMRPTMVARMDSRTRFTGMALEGE